MTTDQTIPPPPTYPPNIPLPVPRPADPPVINITIDTPQPEGPTWGERLQLARNARCLAVALLPAIGWGHVLHQCAAEQSLGGAWVLAGIALAAAAISEYRRTWYARILSWVAVLGPVIGLPAFGSLTYLITGVAP